MEENILASTLIIPVILHDHYFFNSFAELGWESESNLLSFSFSC
jgi:hypothetical protein